ALHGAYGPDPCGRGRLCAADEVALGRSAHPFRQHGRRVYRPYRKECPRMSRLARSMVELTRFHARSLHRNKIALFFNIIFPLLMVAIFGGLYGTPAASRGGGLVDGTGRVLTAFDFLMPGQMAVLVTAAGFVTVAITMAGQRRDGSLRHLLSTPLSVGSWTAARVLANVLMAGVQGVLLFVFAALLFDVSPPANLPGTIVVVLVCTLASLSMGIFVG